MYKQCNNHTIFIFDDTDSIALCNRIGAIYLKNFNFSKINADKFSVLEYIIENSTIHTLIWVCFLMYVKICA